MDLYDFYNTFITAVASDSSTDEWALRYFGKQISVFVDLQSGELPTAAEMPYIIIHTPEAIKDQNRRSNEYLLALDIALDKDSLAIRTENNVEQPAGIELILDLVTLVIAAVKAALPANTTFGYRMSADTLGSLPQIYGYVDLTFTEEITIGTDPLD